MKNHKRTGAFLGFIYENTTHDELSDNIANDAFSDNNSNPKPPKNEEHYFTQWLHSLVAIGVVLFLIILALAILKIACA